MVGSVKVTSGGPFERAKNIVFCHCWATWPDLYGPTVGIFGAKSCAIVVDFIQVLNFENLVNT